MRLNIISSEKVLFEGEADAVTLPGELGSFTVLRNHASLISSLVAGKIFYKDASGEQHEIGIKGGVADVDKNVISVCVY